MIKCKFCPYAEEEKNKAMKLLGLKRLLSLTIIISLFLFSCNPYKKISCSDGSMQLISKKPELYTKSFNLNVKEVTDLIKTNENSTDTITNLKLRSIQEALSSSSEEVSEKIRTSYFAYASAPCDVQNRNAFNNTLVEVSKVNFQLEQLRAKLDTTQTIAFLTQDFTNLINILTTTVAISPSLDEFPKTGSEFDISDLDAFEKKLKDALNKNWFKYETFTQDNITYTKTEYLNLKIPNYSNIGLIALLISRPHPTGNRNQFRIKFISKKQYSALGNELRDGDSRIIEAAEAFFVNFVNSIK